MKKKIFLTLVLVALLACVLVISAYAVEINGVHYTLDSDNGTATVSDSNKTATKSIVEIPSEVEYNGTIYEVNAIATDAFNGNTAVTEVEISSEHITTIATNAFRSCSNLKKVVIKSTNLTEVGAHAFYETKALKEIHIDLSKCERAGNYAFRFYSENNVVVWYDLEGNRRVDLSSMKYLGEFCFCNSNIGGATLETPTEIAWPKGLRSVKAQAFRLSNLTGTVYIAAEEGTTLDIDMYYLFGGVNEIDTIIFGKGVTKINENFFADARITGMNVVFLDTVNCTNGSHIFTSCSDVYVYYKEFTGSPLFSKWATLIQVESITANNYGFCGATADIVTTENEKITVGEINHNYTFIDYDNTYCPMNTMGNYKCSKCQDTKQVAKEGAAPVKDAHSFDTVKSIVYANGYLEAGVKTSVCKCTLEFAENVKAILVFNGYSTNKEQNAICVGYTVNRTELSEYNSVNPKLQFGIVASAKTENILSVSENKVVGAQNTVVAEIENDYASFDFILFGFSESQYELALAVCAYVYDGNEISYLASESTVAPTTVTLKTVIEKTAKEQA